MKNFKYFLQLSLILALVSFSIPTVYSEGMNIKPGLWETKSIVTTPFAGGAQEHVSQECITNDSITPEQLMQNAKNCEILDKEIESNSMSWTVRCTNADIEMLGQGSIQTTKTTLNGLMNITASVNGQEVVMSTSWEGKYIGECS